MELSREQIRTVRDAAVQHANEASDAVIKRRWETVLREAQKALDYDTRTSANNAKK